MCNWPPPAVFLEARCPSLEAHLKYDEQWLREVDQEPCQAYLRVWELTDYAVVLGRSNQPERETHLAACQAAGIPIVRRTSGGGTVLLGPGCLCYSLIVPLPANMSRDVSRLLALLLSQLVNQFHQIGWEISRQGISDLTWRGRKFAGHAQRWLRRAMLHHGSILYNFDLDAISHFLAHPSREPVYRAQREHRDFLINLPLTRTQLVDVLHQTWCRSSTSSSSCSDAH
ncbi:MAG: lipoate--protein ligase A [Planctomycetaceae bacterium]|nr:MAG: lipoate--protein ligase A [Planctomycetaceae bacterium]